MAAKVCAFTGHRPGKLPWGYNENDPRCLALKGRLYDVVDTICASGIDRFLCGMANGCDLYFAETVLLLQEQYPHIRLEAAVPCPGQSSRWSERDRARYESILARCGKVTVISPAYTRSCMMERNRFMVEQCDILLACFDEQKGGTLSTLHMALKQDKEVIILPVSE